LGGELDTATVLRGSSKAQRARLLAATQKGNPRQALGGDLDTATVLRGSSIPGLAARIRKWFPLINP
jgi:hypothetical protein